MTEITLKTADATVLKLEAGDTLLIRVDPDEFTEELQQPFMDALGDMLGSVGLDTDRCLVVAAKTLDVSVIKP